MLEVETHYLRRRGEGPLELLDIELDRDTATRHPALLLHLRHDDVDGTRVARRSLRREMGTAFAVWYVECTARDVERMPHAAQERPGARRLAPYTRDAPEVAATRRWLAEVLAMYDHRLLRSQPVRLVRSRFHPAADAGEGRLVIDLRHDQVVGDRLLTLPLREADGGPMAPLDAVEDLQSNIGSLLDPAWVDRLPPAAA